MRRKMKLTDEQKSTVRSWAAAGADLNDIQNKLRDEFGLRMTFLEVRFLVLDLNITLHSDPVEPEAEDDSPEPETLLDDETVGGVQLTGDEIAIPGCIASGKVTFSDGVQARWNLDQMGRLGLQGAEPGYQPPPEDVPEFQKKLQDHLRRSGMY